MDSVMKKEEEYLKKYREKTDSLLNRKLEEKVPDNLQSKLDTAFSKLLPLCSRRAQA